MSNDPMTVVKRLALCAAICAPGVSHAETEQTVSLANVAISVGQMLEIDTYLALHKEGQRKAEAMNMQTPVAANPDVALNSKPSPEATKPEAPEVEVEKPKAPVLAVEGIFGMGSRLYADVNVDGQKVRFQSQQRYPVGYGSYPWQLVSIDVPCVKLKGQEGQKKLCIDGL